MNKRGLDNILTVVLMVLLVLGAFVILFGVIRTFVGGAGEDFQREIEFSSLSFTIIQESIKVNGDISFLLERKAGEGEFDGFIVVLTNDDGNTARVDNYKNYGSDSFSELMRVNVQISSEDYSLTGRIVLITIYAVREEKISQPFVSAEDYDKNDVFRVISGGGGGGGVSGNINPPPEPPVLLSCGFVPKVDCELTANAGNCFCDKTSLDPINPNYIPLMNQQELIDAFSKYYYWKSSESCEFGSNAAGVETCYLNSKERYVEDANSGYATAYYYSFVPIRALTKLYIITRNQSYLDEAKWYADTMIDKAITDPSKPTFLYWPTNATNPSRSQIQELQAGESLTHFARFLKNQGDSDWQKYAYFVKGNITDYWANKEGKGRCGPSSAVNNPVKCIPDAADKHSKFALSALDIYHMTGETEYLNWAEQVLANQKENYTIVNGDVVEWYAGPLHNPSSSSFPGGAIKPWDTSHQNRYPEMVYRAYEDGVIYNEIDLIKTVNTLLFKMWEANWTVKVNGAEWYPNLYRGSMNGKVSGKDFNYNLTTGQFYDHVCGTGLIDDYKHGTLGWDFVTLGRYDERVRELMDNLTYSVVNQEVVVFINGCSPPNIGAGGRNRNYDNTLGLITETMYQNYLAECEEDNSCVYDF